MIVVSDAGPLHYLVLIGQIELLDQLRQTNFFVSPQVLKSLIAALRSKNP